MAKVDVVTVEEVKIKKWCWWSNWIDICVFNYAGQGNLLQMRVGRNNAKQFVHRTMANTFSSDQCNLQDAGDLTQMKKGGAQ